MKRSRTWDRVGSDVASKLLEAIDRLPNNELRALRTFATRANQTNVSWSAYAVREFMSERAAEILKWRQRTARALVRSAELATTGSAPRGES